VVGIFESYDDARNAVYDLRAALRTPGEVTLLADGADLAGADSGLSDAASGAAAGAALGGLLGALAGWMAGVGALAIPGVGASASGMQLTSTLGGLGLGAVVGGLIGAISKLGPQNARNAEVDTLRGHLREGRVLVAVQSLGLLDSRTKDILRANGAEDITAFSGILTGARSEGSAPARVATAADEEINLMDDKQTGRNLDNVTGTEGAIDPETGAFGTAGTPLTTGYGVSGSTVGVGSSEVEGSYEDGDFTGSTPDLKAYDMGGRSSDDAMAGGDGEADRISVGDTYNATNTDRAAVQQEPEERDVYQQGPSYGPDTDTHAATDATEHYSSAAVDEGPSYGAVSNEQSQASGGTDIPGTSDPRGIGDNTDDPNLRD
jgi:hypothetical protein